MSLTDTIVAISTALDEAAISIVRMSGSEAVEIANKVFSKDLTDVKSFSAHYGQIKDPLEGVVLDEVIVNVFKAPKTYTCEDIVEINCHGGIVVTKQILTLLLSQGARMAEPGEFTQRAFLNGRIDLAQAEATLDIIEAPSEHASQFAAMGIAGSVKRLIEPLTSKMMDVIAHIETNIDYPEYTDIEQLTHEQVLPLSYEIKDEMEVILKRAQTGQIVKEGLKTVILGKPNVGKSSLLNALLEEDKAIVTDIAGTTRDLVEGWIRLENVSLHLIDTAGLRETEDVVEKIGIDRTKEALEKAQLAIVVLDASEQLDEQDEMILDMTKDMDRFVVYNKSDLVDKNNEMSISAMLGDVTSLVDAINKKYQDTQVVLNNPTLANERQIGLMKQAYESLLRAIEAGEMGIELDLVNIDLTASYTQLRSILSPQGEINLLGEIFSRFCLGK